MRYHLLMEWILVVKIMTGVMENVVNNTPVMKRLEQIVLGYAIEH